MCLIRLRDMLSHFPFRYGLLPSSEPDQYWEISLKSPLFPLLLHCCKISSLTLYCIAGSSIQASFSLSFLIRDHILSASEDSPLTLLLGNQGPEGWWKANSTFHGFWGQSPSLDSDTPSMAPKPGGQPQGRLSLGVAGSCKSARTPVVGEKGTSWEEWSADCRDSPGWGWALSASPGALQKNAMSAHGRGLHCTRVEPRYAQVQWLSRCFPNTGGGWLGKEQSDKCKQTLLSSEGSWGLIFLFYLCPSIPENIWTPVT